MALVQVPYPLVNGNRYSFSSIECNISGVLFLGVKEIQYADVLEPGKLYGTSGQKLGRTRGNYDPEASITMFKEEWLFFQQLLTTPLSGYMETVFDIVVVFAELLAAGIAPQTDVIRGARVKKAEDAYSQSPEALVVKCDLDIMYVSKNFKLPFAQLIPG